MKLNNVVAGLLLVLLSVFSRAFAGSLRTVAFSEYPVPGMSNDVFFSKFDPPALNDSGQTAFRGFLNSSTTNSGIWSELGGDGLALIAHSGNAAPGTSSGVVFSSFSFPLLNNTGQTAFRGDLSGTGVDSSNRGGIWSTGQGSGLALVVRRGDVALNSGGANFSFFDNLLLNDVGQIAFSAGLTGVGVDDSNNRGIWSQEAGTRLNMVARTGETAPGTSGGVRFSDFRAPVLNDFGQTAFSGSLIGTAVNNFNNIGIWSERGGSGLSLVARSGNVAPGTSSGVNFRGFGIPTINRAGYTAFIGSLIGTSVEPFVNSLGIWSEGGGNGLALVARSGSEAPDTGGAVFSESLFGKFSDPVLNRMGQVAFFGGLRGTGINASNNRGIWSGGGRQRIETGCTQWRSGSRHNQRR